MIPERRMLWLFIAVKCIKFSNRKDSREHATMVVNQLRNDEEVEFVRNIL